MATISFSFMNGSSIARLTKAAGNGATHRGLCLAPNPPPPRALPLAQESLTKQPIVRHSVYQNQCDDDCAYKNPNLVCFAPRPIRAVNPENLADQISNHAVMRKL